MLVKILSVDENQLGTPFLENKMESAEIKIEQSLQDNYSPLGNISKGNEVSI